MILYVVNTITNWHIFYINVCAAFVPFFVDVMKALIEKCVDGASTLELCKFGDEMVATEVSAKYKKIAKGAVI